MTRHPLVVLLVLAAAGGAVAGCKLPKRKGKDAGAPISYTAPTYTTPTSTSTVGSVDPEEVVKKQYLKHKSGCDSGDTFACVNVGFDYQKGLGVPKDETTAADYYKKACDAHTRDGAEGCADLAWLYEMGLGLPKDEVKAAALYKQGCDLGAKLGCNNLGVMYRD